jgi:hypothetical protein
MSLRTAILGTLFVALAFGSAFVLASPGGRPPLAQTTGSETIAVQRDLAAIPFLAPHGPPPRLAKRGRHHRRAAHRTRLTPTPAPLETGRHHSPLRPSAPSGGRPREVPRPSPPPEDPGDDSAPPESVPAPVTPVPTQAARPAEPDPGDQTDEDPNAEAPE